MDLHIILMAIFIVITYKCGEWRNWKTYYHTILFLVAGDLMYYYVFSDNRLWYAASPNLSSKQIELLWKIVLYPCIVLILLPWYLKCKSFKNQVGYTFLWILVFSILELVVLKFKFIYYGNGWSYYWSVVFYSIMFPILIVHHFKPLLAIMLSAICGIVALIIFNGSIYV